jgi:hypothetical protein
MDFTLPHFQLQQPGLLDKITGFFDPVFSYIGGEHSYIIGALVLLIVGLFVARMVRRLVAKALGSMKLDERVNKGGGKRFQLEKLISKLFYYLMVIYVCMIVLSKLHVGDVFAPIEAMLQDFLSAIPQILKAGIIAFAGYIIAKLASEAVELLTESLNKLSTRLGFDATSFNLISILKQVVFIFVFIPILVIAIDELGMEAVSGPATEMLQKFMAAIPNIIGAALIIGIFYLIAKFIAPALKELLKNLGTDELPQKMGINFMEGRSLSGIASSVVFFFIMIAGITSGLERLEMGTVVTALNDVMGLSGKILFGLVIMVLGNFVAKVAYNSLSGSKDNAGLASIARVAIMGIFFGIGLNAMGIANEIVNLAFGLTLGAVAVAIALSFGLGGREAAGKQMDHILKRFRKD